MQRTKFQAMIGGRCPRCRQGKVFMAPWWQVTKFSRMHEHCPHCGLRYEVEPGLFFGAMFISYAISVGIMIGIGVLSFVIFNDPDNIWLYYIIPITVASLVAVPFNFRISRVIMLHLFSGVRYEENLSNRSL
ncbi:MAG: DUF983 domain-containing protein [Cytophagaceae bacterium]|nr:DUF983 domain-containing protein [Cytophagaceae bacterium]